ncbi:MAG TPA: amidohydrolase family protein [Candidatus Dormibacteraeota bacterium]|nr:amidohydrolase family protein [Candidatus Dormibacteraeota bacterium]
MATAVTPATEARAFRETRARVLSADSHICEPGDLWTSYVEPRFRDRAPRIVEDPERGDVWKAEGLTLPNIAAMGGKDRTSETVPIKPSFERDIMRGGWDPEQRIKDMDAVGVDGQILFPTVGFHLYGLEDPYLLRAVFTAWNNWVRDFCKGREKRLRGVGFLSLDDIDWAIAEMKRCKEMGLVAANIPLTPMDPPYSHAYYEPFWSAAEDLEMPLVSHTGSVRGPACMARQPNAFAERFTPIHKRPWSVFVGTGMAPVAVSRFVNELILSRVVQRHPKLCIIPTEFEAGWAAFWLDRLDETLVNERMRMGSVPLDYKPSEFFRRNFALTFIDDMTAVAARDIIGVENLLWSDDFPHIDGIWTHNADYVFDRCFVETRTSDEDRQKLLGSNMTRIFKCFDS